MAKMKKSLVQLVDLNPFLRDTAWISSTRSTTTRYVCSNSICIRSARSIEAAACFAAQYVLVHSSSELQEDPVERAPKCDKVSRESMASAGMASEAEADNSSSNSKSGTQIAQLGICAGGLRVVRGLSHRYRTSSWRLSYEKPPPSSLHGSIRGRSESLGARSWPLWKLQRGLCWCLLEVVLKVKLMCTI